jgi:hypothetical protein
MSRVEDILRDPSAAFPEPGDVLSQEDLSRDDKVRILRQWRYDLVQLQVASGENLIGDAEGAAQLTKIDEYLRQLSADDGN